MHLPVLTKVVSVDLEKKKVYVCVWGGGWGGGSNDMNEYENAESNRKKGRKGHSQSL